MVAGVAIIVAGSHHPSCYRRHCSWRCCHCRWRRVPGLMAVILVIVDGVEMLSLVMPTAAVVAIIDDRGNQL